MKASWKARFFTIWTGQAFSLFGSSIVQFALVWWLTTTTGSATVLATAALVGVLPQVVLGPLAGVIVDRFSRRAIMLIADGLIAVFTLGLAYLFAVGAVQVWHIYAILFIRSLSGTFHFSAMQASTSLMVPQQQLSRIAGMNQTLQGLMSIVAPPVGALLISVLPIFQVMLIDVFTALLAILPLCFIAVPQPKRAHAFAVSGEIQHASVLDDLRAGVRYVFSWPGLAIVMGMAMLINFLVTPAASLMPILITRHYQGGAPELATMNAVWGGGMVLGGVLLSVWGGFKRRILTSLMGIMMIGACLTVQSVLPPSAFVIAVGVWMLLGVASPITNGPVFAVLQATVAPAMQGRVMTLIMAAAMAMTPLSLLVAGPVADALGVQVWYAMGGLACMLMGVGGLFVPALVNIESQKAQMDERQVVPAASLYPAADGSRE